MFLSNFLARHSRFIGHVATMMSGKTVAAAIALFTTPIVARLFEPTDFGVAASWLAMITIVRNIASLRYESAFSLPKDEHEARLLVALAYRAMIAICLLVLLLVAVNHFTGAKLAPLEVVGGWAWALPFGLFLTASLQIQESWLTRRTRFKLSSASLVAGNLVTSGSRIGFGTLYGSSVWGLITGHLLGILGRLVIQRAATRDAFHGAGPRADWGSLWKTAKAYSDFPRLNAPAGLIFSLGGNMPVLLFGVMFSPAVAGLYAMANRLTRVPISIVAASVRRVFLQKAADIRNRGRSLRKAYVLTTGGLAAFGVLPLILALLYARPVLGWLLGEQWLEAGLYVEILAPWMFMLWVTAPANPVFIVLRKQQLWLYLLVGITTMRLAAFGAAWWVSATAEQTLRMFVIVTVVGNLVTIATAFSLIGREPASKAMAGAPESAG